MSRKTLAQEKFLKTNKKFLKLKRFFTKKGVHPYDEVKWIKTTAEIPGSNFKMESVEFPDFYSQNAINIIASKYFKINRGKQEKSLKELIDRIVKTFKKWGLEQGYFDEENANIFENELTYILLHQLAAFNSPVWFNVGVAGRSQQCSACFILDVEDNMESILDWIKTEGMIFKNGSGAGINLSKLRAKGEKLSAGGSSSGVISFMKAADAVAGSIKSGGTTRRAAKMVVLNVDHPEIMDFIRVKAEEENKVRALMSAGYDMTDLNNPLWQNIFFQNANNSIRATNEFMQAVEKDKEWETYYRTIKKPAQTYKAREILWEAAKSAWECGDPGIQFHDIVNRWNTCKNSGEIVATNPCITGETLIATNEGWRRIKDLIGKNPILITPQGEQKAIKVWKTGTKPIYKIITRSGYELRATEDHPIYIEGKGDVLVKDLKKGDKVVLIGAGFGKEQLEKKVALMIGYTLGDGSVTFNRRPIYYFANTLSTKYPISRQATLRKMQTEFVVASAKESVNQVISQYAILDEGSERKRFTDKIFNLDKESIRYILKGLFTADGTITGNPQKGFYIGLDSSSLDLLKQVQLLLLNFGIKAKIYQNRRKALESFLPDSERKLKKYKVKQLHSLRITRSSRIIFEREIGFYEIHPKQEKLEEINQNYEAYKDYLVDEIKEIIYDGIEDVYDLSEPVTQHFVANGILVHNCSEYNWFNWTSCNLASINLLKFLKDDGTFDIPAFKHTAKIIFLAQDILITPADYPHSKIAEETKKYRTIGLGYTNLGALIMALGLPYDSDLARGLAGAITSLMTGVAYKTSTEISEIVGPFPEYYKNVDSFLEVMEMHRNESYKVKSYDQKITEEILNEANKTWDEVIERGKIYGFRNAQATVLAPTGCLTGNSLVSTEFGLVPLETLGNPLGEKWQDLNIKVMTDEGEKLATKFFINGLAETRKIITQNGYEIIGTPEHRVKVFDKETGELKWKYFADIKEGDIVALEMNTLFGSPQPIELPPLPELHWNQDFEAKVPRHMNEELAEIIGYFMGDGSLHSKGLRFCVYKEDKDVIQRLKELIKRQFNLNVKLTPRIGYIEVAVNSVPLAIWWSACGFAKKQKTQGKGWEPHIPLAVLYSNDPKVYKAFLRGLFEADGTVYKDANVPALSTHSKNFHNQIKSLLLALGFPTKSKIGVSGWGRKNLYVLYIKNKDYALKFKEEIGFIGKRKNSLIRGSKHTPRMDRIYLSEILVKEIMPVVGKKDRDILRLEFKRGGFVSRYFAQRILQQTNNDLLSFYTQKIFFDPVIKNESNGEALTYDLSVPENVTYIANGFISHNTISFMMDCDTTGIEPDFALVKMKQLVGGGWMKIVNKTVSLALQRLGYSEKEIEDIIKYLEETQNIENSPHLKPEHLSVFDCAINPPGGQRSISLDGHIKMVAAVQPFISGAISKTFNMPNSATIEDVYNAYLNAWKLGIKCFAIYRDGSKATQALFTQKSSKKKDEIERRKLPMVRQSETHKFAVAGHEGYLTYGMFEDGTLGEIFIRMSKQGSTLAGLLDAFAIAVSIALQYGVPLKELANKFIYMRFEPMGVTNNQEIPIASSIIDYIFKYLAYKFLTPEELQEIGLEVKEKSILKEHPKLIDLNFEMVKVKENKNLAGPPCKYCGGMTTRTGSCYTCLECGETTGGCN
jgi:ribonucleoside-diphosphate reductase alpha chain